MSCKMNGVVISRLRQKFAAVLRGIHQGKCFKPAFMTNKTGKWEQNAEITKAKGGW
ncbi:hypothetical protein B7P43_G15613 [Cryptotermes secundus]|uniref:Uncharacterized protein n=1 Tax=Cryptotermes secundus TaxID=105785 RepID=A0A2J7PPN0_9NEOP|nr:hypothetical protein B7P43_G15613 [Cryptotermes secundus]